MLVLLALALTLRPEIIEELNRVRQQPAAYARQMRRQRIYYEGTLLRRPGQLPIRTREGLRAVDEAIHELESTKSLPLLEGSTPLAEAAQSHAAEIGSSDALSHRSADGRSPGDRIRKAIPTAKITGEAISFGPSTAAEVIFDLLVDDGVAGRGHRKLLLSPRFDMAGAACGPHKTYGTVCVIDLAK